MVKILFLTHSVFFIYIKIIDALDYTAMFFFRKIFNPFVKYFFLYIIALPPVFV